MGFLILLLIIAVFVLFIKNGNLAQRVDELEIKVFSGKSKTAIHTAPPETREPKQEPSKTAFAAHGGVTQEAPRKQTPPEPEPQPIRAQESPVPNATPPLQEEPSVFENFTIIKLFSWLGGLALFLGLVFFVKYSIENNLISPAMRVIISSITGLALIAAGVFIKNPKYKITSDTLCGSGVAVLYASVYGGYVFYQLISLPAAFVIMAAISLSSFFLARVQNAKYIAVLGVIIAFLTPLLLSTGVDRPFILFGFIAIVNAGALLAGVKKEWTSVIVLCLTLTFLMQSGWMAQRGRLLDLDIMLPIFSAYAAATAALAYGFNSTVNGSIRNAFSKYLWLCLAFAVFPLIILNPGVSGNVKILGFAFLLNILSTALFVKNPEENYGNFTASSILMFAALMFVKTTGSMFYISLGAYTLFALINIGTSYVFPSVKSASGGKAGLLTSLLPALLLGLIVFKFDMAGIFALAPFVMLFFAADVYNSAYNKKYFPAFISGALLLLIFLLGVCAPHGGEAYLSIILVLCISAFVPLLTGILMSFTGIEKNENTQRLTTLSSFMPFVLMLAALGQFDTAPDVLFYIFALAITALAAFFAVSYKKYANVLFSAAALACVQFFYLARFWHQADIMTVMVFFILPCAAFTVLSFALKEKEKTSFAWAAAALQALTAFTFTYLVLRFNYTVSYINGLALVFAAVYAPIAVYLYKENKENKPRLALVGGAALFFISVFFPLELSDNWLTIALAVEGAALAWLALKIDYKPLEKVAFGFMAAVFIRLVCNPFILQYYPTGTKILNWILSTYGVCAAAVFGGAYLIKNKTLKNIANLFALAILFALVNLEIADFYSTTAYLNFSIFGNFAVTATYTLAWALFGFAVMLAGLKLKYTALRRIGIALISIATAKLFLSDVWQLKTLYRIITLIGMAPILIIVSAAYQKMKKDPDKI